MQPPTDGAHGYKPDLAIFKPIIGNRNGVAPVENRHIGEIEPSRQKRLLPLWLIPFIEVFVTSIHIINIYMKNLPAIHDSVCHEDGFLLQGASA